MVISNRLMMTLASLTIMTSAAAFGQTPPAVDVTKEQSEVRQSENQSERYFSEDPADDSRTSRFRSAAGSAGTSSLQRSASFTRPLSGRVSPGTISNPLPGRSQETSDRFVPCGIIVSTRGRLSIDDLVQEATYPKTWSLPVVVLIDGDSASGACRPRTLSTASNSSLNGIVDPIYPGTMIRQATCRQCRSQRIDDASFQRLSLTLRSHVERTISE